MKDSFHRESTDTDVVELLRSLIVAFVLAMAFRGFILEPFVIPSGSMAPTLMGQHCRWTSDLTGYQFPFDSREVADRFPANDDRLLEIPDPMLGPDSPPLVVDQGTLRRRVRMGDRIVVLKALYRFGFLSGLFEPHRWDVTVFKCPMQPFGDKQNFIKRTVGLPNETLLLADGDVFTSPNMNASLNDLHIQRKPDYLQRALWQPVSNTDYIPVAIDRPSATLMADYVGPWRGDGWILRGESSLSRSLRYDSADRTILHWENSIRPVDDWTAYNLLSRQIPTILRYPVSDIRVGASIEADAPTALSTEFQLHARRHWFRFKLGPGLAAVSIGSAADDHPLQESHVSWQPPSHGAIEVEFWHVDQRLAIYVDGKLIVELPYEWDAGTRLANALENPDLDHFDPMRATEEQPTLEWAFEGSPLVMRRLRLDRDIHYRPENFSRRNREALSDSISRGIAFATDPLYPARLGPDEFLMCGDNSPSSDDGRLWGSAHALVEMQFDRSPFVVHRSLLLGKAWAVYFPSPMPIRESGRTLIPDLGRIRFIR